MSVETTGNEECGDLVGGNSNDGGSSIEIMEMENGGVKPSDFVKEILEVVERINKADGTTKNGQASQSPLAIKLEERFNSFNLKIKELEGQLTEASGENDVLKEKLDEMEHLAGYQQTELVRLKCDLEAEKWERFDAESRLKKMVKEIAELHAAVGELLGRLKVGEERAVVMPAITAQTSEHPVIKKEVVEREDRDEELVERYQFGDEEAEKRAEFRCLFLDLSSQLHDRLQKCEERQLETKSNINGMVRGLAEVEEMICGGRSPGKVPMPSKTSNGNVTTTEVLKFQKRVPQTHYPTPMVRPPSTAVPVPIKSILMKRSADGTFVIRRDSQEQQQKQQPVGAAKRKRVQFCLEDPNIVTVQTEYKENHRQFSHHHQFPPLPPDPLEVDIDQFQQPQYDVEHFEVTMKGGLTNKFYCNCGRGFTYKKLLNRHLSAKQNGKIFNCLMCSKTFVLHESLKRHVQKSHRVQYHGGRYGCRECGQTFTMYRQLRQHRSTHQRRKLMAYG